MTSEQYQRVGELYHAAMELAPEARVDFLTGACGDDDELRREVESLLQAHQQAGSYFGAPALEVAAELLANKKSPSLIGRRLSHYQVLSLIGAGGMGQVFLANDTRLGRKVALKVLPPEFTGDPDRIRRFEQEAKAASALNQPNILTIYEIDEIGNCHFIVSEYVEGETLRQRMKNGEMTLNAALDVAIQVASALSAAHAAGITHRDIKPENVMVRPDGLVKVLDFGLAKLSEAQLPPADSQASTLAKLSTAPGVVMGTVSYMSPEQARGLKVDHRTDIFSLGVMLYEMVAGRRPFEGETTSDVIAAILQNEPPPLTAHLPNTPSELERIISKALRKERDERYQFAKDLLLDLKSFQQGSNSAAAGATMERGTKRPWFHTSQVWRLSLISLAVLLATVGGVFWWYSRREAPPAPIGHSLPLTSDLGFELNPALSPDGKQVAFAWNGKQQDNFDIYINLVGSNSRLRLTTNPAEDLSPAWSPDGRLIAFLRRLGDDRNELLLVPALGGPERKLTETVIVDHRRGRFPSLAWSPDGRWIAVSHREAGDLAESLFLVSVQTGEKRLLTRLSVDSEGDFMPAFSPDGRTLLFARFFGFSSVKVYLLSLSEDFEPVGEARTLKTEEQFVSSPVWTLDGRHVLYLAAPNIGPREQTELRKIAVSSTSVSERVLLLEGVINEVSLGRHLIYARFAYDTDIWRAEISPSVGKASQPQRLISSTRLDYQPRYSPDGKKIAFGSTRSGAPEMWVVDADGSNPEQLTFFGGGLVGIKDWSPDGQRLVFHARPEGPSDIFTIPATGGVPKRLTTDPADDATPSYSRDGRWIYFHSSRSGQREIWKMPAEGGDAVKITSIGGRLPFESFDGKTLYFMALSQQKGIWKIPVQGGEATQVVTEPLNEIGYAVGAEGIFYSPVTDSGQKGLIRFVNFSTGKSRVVVMMDRPIVNTMCLSPDQRFLLFTPSDQTGSDLMVIENFVVH